MGKKLNFQNISGFWPLLYVYREKKIGLELEGSLLTPQVCPVPALSCLVEKRNELTINENQSIHI